MSDFRKQKIQLVLDTVNLALEKQGPSRLFLVDNDLGPEEVVRHLQPSWVCGRWKLETPWHPPYEPFMGTLKCWFRHLGEEERRRLLKTVYPLHRQTLVSYLLDQKFRAREPLLNDEFDYENFKWRQALGTLFLKSQEGRGSQPRLYILENANYLMPSSYELLKTIAADPRATSIFLLFYEPNFPGLQGFSVIESLIGEIDHRSPGFALEVISSEQEERPPWLFDEPKLEERLSLIRLQRVLASWEDIIITAKPLVENDLEGEEDARRRALLNEIFLTYSDVLNKKGDYRKAYLYARRVLQGVRESQESEYVVIAQIQMATAELLANSRDSATYYTQMAMKLAQNLGNTRLELLAKLILFHVRTGVSDLALYEDLIQQLKRMRWRNWSALIRSFGGYNAAIIRSHPEHKEKAFSLVQEGVALARSLKNEFRLAACYQALGVLQSITGDIDQARGYYRKSLAIKKRLGDPHQLAKILNSLGYLELLQGNFALSFRYFREAFQALSRTRVYIEICGTLYNLGKVYLLLNVYGEAIRCFEGMLKIMDKLEIQNLAFQPRMTILSLIGIAAYQEGARISAWNALQKIHRLPNYQDQSQTNPLYWLLLILLQSPKLLSLEYIRQFREHAHNEGYPFLLYGLMAIGDHVATEQPDLAYELWKEGLDLCQNKQMIDLFMHQFRRRLEGVNGTGETPLKLPKIPFDVGPILVMVGEEQNLNSLERKIHEIDFISQFQNLVIVHEKRQHLIENSHLLLSLHFAHDAAIIALKPQEIYTSQIDLQDQGPLLWSLVEQEDRNQLSNWAKLRGYLAVEMVRVATKQEKHLALVLFSQREHFQLTADDRKILTVFLGQFDAAMELIAAREALVLAAKTDKLTGLYNRLELERILFNEYSRQRRYAHVGEGAFSLMFLDMDNFKFCNDNYGHHIGDLVLVEFAQLLRRAVREVDSIGRLGGDEFVILLPETNRHQAAVVAQRVFDMLEDRQGFVPKIEEAIGKPLDLRTHKPISCSIGIVEVSPEDQRSIQEHLSLADRALYEAKRLGKNRYVIGDS